MKSPGIIFLLVHCALCGSLNLINTALSPAETLLLDQLSALAKQLNATESSLHRLQLNYVSLFIYTQASPNGTEVALTDAGRLTEVSPFNLQLKTILYSHGWMGRYDGPATTAVKDTLLQAANVNIVVVSWSSCAFNINYFAAKQCTPSVGKQIAEFILTVSQKYNYSLNNITAVGHSLGAHLSGCTGKYTNGTLGVIIGLDPAGPFYYEGDTDERLTAKDAQYVQVFHTDARLLGIGYSIGVSDYWPNGGYMQNGCFILDDWCSHNAAWKFYDESVTNNTFSAKRCAGYIDYQHGLCRQNSKALMGGLEVDTSAVGNYYLITNAESPYGKGDV